MPTQWEPPLDSQDRQSQRETAFHPPQRRATAIFLSFFFKKSHLSVANALLFKRWNEPIGCHKIPQGAHDQRLDHVTHLDCALDSN